MRRLLIALALGACASPGFPPGGPEDTSAPKLVSASPDSGALQAPTRGEAEFQFDEVLSERPSGAPSLSALVLVSPRDGEPRVGWHRSRITVRPRHDWRDNTVYTITILPGLADLRNNARRNPVVSVFSTGPTMPATIIGGIAYDWATGTPARGATVEAIAADSTVYVAAADSSGTYALAHLAPGRYAVRAYQDADRNHIVGLREAWDSTTVALTDSAVRDLYLFVHDSLGPRITDVTVRDSLSLRVAFDKPIDIRQEIDTAMFRLITADSTPVRVVSARPAREVEGVADSAARVPAPAVPIGPVRRDTAVAAPAPPPRPRRQSPVQSVLLQVFTPLRPATSYRLTALDVRNLLGLSATTSRTFTTPRAVEPRAVVPGDSLRRTPPDSARPPAAARPPR